MSTPFVVAFVVGVTPNKWVGVWKERMPDLPIEVRPASADEARAWLADGTVDAAFLRFGETPVATDEHSVIALYTEQPVVVAPKDHALTAFDAVDLADLGSEIVLDGQDADTIELVAANVGVAIMPQSVARVHSRRDVTARLLTGVPVTQVALVWPVDRTTPEVEEFIGIVRGRTANSSRSSQPEAEPAKKQAPRKSPPAAKGGTATRKPGTRFPRSSGRQKRR
jgi:DNA-binding transcriptional LysR family regulator